VLSEIERYENFDFNGDRLSLLVDARGRFVSLASLCDSLGLDTALQWRALRAREEFDTETVVEDRDGYRVAYIRVEAVPLWLLTVRPADLRAEARPKHAKYKRDLIRATYEFTTRGVAIKEGTPLLAVFQAAGEFALKLNPCDRTRLLVSSLIESEMARMIGQSPAGDLPVTVASRIQELAIRDARVRKVDRKEWRQRIGTMCAGEYRRRTGAAPQKFPQFIDGAVRHVASYRAADVPLLDEVIYRAVRLAESHG
jgi:hypothetical protein